MSYTVPDLTIKLKLNNKEITSGSKISFQPGFCELALVYNSSNCSMTYAEVRITKADNEDYDIGIGNLAALDYGSISANEDHTLSFNATDVLFDEGDGTYRVSLYVKSAIDGSWNEYHLFITFDGFEFAPKEEESSEYTDGLDVITIQGRPGEFTNPQQTTNVLEIDSSKDSSQSGSEVIIN